jgi:hypothetical protein
MPKFALRFPYFILMLCLMVFLIGIVNLFSMPVDLFPDIDMPVVVVATFYNGMPPQQIEADITNTFERFSPSPPTSTTANPAPSPESASSRFTSSPALTPTPRSRTSPTSRWPIFAVSRQERCRRLSWA